MISMGFSQRPTGERSRVYELMTTGEKAHHGEFWGTSVRVGSEKT